ncbi:MAG TPA: ABC transporter substrate-binding protein [Baekduia sp.]|nr:ABC transporter substrate-binding protein [Baekduia sp.]
MRRTGYVTAAAVCAAIGLSACGGSSGSGDDGGGAQAAVAAGRDSSQARQCTATPRKGGTLVYARQSEAQSLDPINLRNGNGDIFANELIYSGLVRSDPTGKTDDLVGGVADRWKASKDGKTYTFHIRPGIKFTNGDPVTAEDVKFTLDRFGDPKINQVMSVVAGGYGSSKVVDPSTVQVHLTKPVASFLYNISIFPAFIVPKKLVQQQGDAFFKHPVGTGPYKVKEFVRGSHITFERNPYYWEKGKPYLDEVRFDFASDSNSRMLAVKSGQAQIADGVPFSQINALSGDQRLQLQSVKVPLFIGMWLNHQRKPLADLKVRQAMQYALDRKQINEGIFRGVGTIPNSVLPALKYDASADQVPPYSYDLAKAKQLMSESGFADGFSTTLQYPAGYDYYKQLGLLIQQQLGQIGIKVKLIEQDAAEVTDRFDKSDYDMTFPYPQFTSDVVVPDEYATFVANSPDLDGFFTHWSDPKIAQMVQEFTTTPDEAKRAQMWPDIQKAMLDASPVINVMDVPYVNVHGKSVCGTSVNALGVDHLEDTWIASSAGTE